MCNIYVYIIHGYLQHNALILLLEPLNSVVFGHLLSQANSRSSGLSSGHSSSRSLQDNVKVHTEDTSGRIVLDTQVNVLRDAETEVAGVGEVGRLKFVLLHLQASVQDLGSLLTSNSAVASDLFVSSDTEGSEGVSS